jgi:ribonuclease VapC
VIVVDTSALVAIYRREPDSRQLYDAIVRASERIMPASCFVEFIMLRRYGGDRKSWITFLVGAQDMRLADFTGEMAGLAADAAERYGRGSGHPARLNFGDCLSYAVAKHLGAPLLYKGDDFTHTDIESALPA